MSFASPTKRRVPPQPYIPAQGWRVANAASHRVLPPISFDYAGHRPGQGVSMRDLRLKSTATPLLGAADPVLAPSGLQRVVFRIIWPGYGHVEWCRTMPVVSPSGAPITRVALAVQIATSFASWFEKTQYEQPTSPEWMISPACVQFKHMYLVSLVNTFEDVWQADVALDVC
ncbi:hypothetical protein MIND_01409300 [Mycena indigotica]|uniref:Uncharacterized protein n=1 Tax=Mycena indigotica TaxID=2126181 RepID=A0A8H6RYJ2_9AGAR|nr:uncharacterized protein MIND_01409300 [Mycena indigotica]KAF7288930.1 hypothetical protein MIND_01409300 [Mycena indigotica]